MAHYSIPLPDLEGLCLCFFFGPFLILLFSSQILLLFARLPVQEGRYSGGQGNQGLGRYSECGGRAFRDEDALYGPECGLARTGQFFEEHLALISGLPVGAFVLHVLHGLGDAERQQRRQLFPVEQCRGRLKNPKKYLVFCFFRLSKLGFGSCTPRPAR